MRILWFTNTTSLYPLKATSNLVGGWIEALERKFYCAEDIELAIAFDYSVKGAPSITVNNVTYFPVYSNLGNKFIRVLRNILKLKFSNDDISAYIQVVKRFNPDIITVFGTEGRFGLIASSTSVPVIIHIQGIVNSCLFNWYPPGISRKNFNACFDMEWFLHNTGPRNDEDKFIKSAERELKIMGANSYFMGRTEWDREIVSLLAPQAKYYHCNEILRPEFYSAKKWKPKSRDRIVIISILSDVMYKGIDLVFKSAKVLKSFSSIDFQWKIIGLSSESGLIRFFEKHLGILSVAHNIHLQGRMGTSELIDELLDADMYIHTSYIDNSPNSLCEAQYLGVPVIACDVGGISTLVHDDSDGVLVPTNDPYSLAQKIIIIAGNKSIASRYGSAGMENAVKRHDIDNIFDNLTSIYHDVLITNNNKQSIFEDSDKYK